MAENKLPKDWKYKKFVDICLPKEGLKRGPFGSAIKKEFFVPDGNKVYEQSNAIYDDAFRGKYFVDDEKYNELINFNVIPGDIIVSCSGTLGRISVIPANAKKGIINQALLRIRIIESEVSKKFFLYFFRSADFQRKILVQSQGTAITNMVGMKDFKEIEIPLPSLETQQAIVSKIEELFSELDKGIEDLKTAQQQLKTYRQSVLKWAFKGKLTNDNVKDDELPKGWELKDLGDVFKVSSGKGIKINQLKGGDYCVYGGNGLNGYHSEYFIEEPVLIIGRVGVKCGVTHITKPKSWVSDNALIVKPIIEDFDIKFFKLRLEFENLNKLSVSTAQPVISGNSIYSVSLSLPKKEEQQIIVQEIESRLSVADKMEESIAQSLQQAEALRQSILKKAFSGELV